MRYCHTAEADCSDPRCASDSDDGCQFDNWLRVLEEDVIQDDFGYEPGEFSVYPIQWRPLYTEGVTPAQAFQLALDAFAENRAK